MEQVREAAAAAPADTALDGYAACQLKELLVGEPLPVTIYAYFKSRIIPFRQEGGLIDRYTYDRLELKKIMELFVLDGELLKLQEWHKAKMPAAQVSTAFKEKGDTLPAARESVRESVFELFSASHPNEKIAKAATASKKLVDGVMKFPYASRPLSHLQSYSKGTVDHSVNVSMLSTYLGLHLGYSSALILQHLAVGSLLHDIGLTELPIEEGDSPAEIKRKTKLHPQIGTGMLEKEAGTPNEVMMIVGQCHEAYDGSGYPEGIRSFRIYELARVVAIAHTFEELVADGSGSMPDRYKFAVNELGSKLAHRFEPKKLEKALKVLSLGL